MQIVKFQAGWKAREWQPADPLTGKRRRLIATGRTKAEARERLEAKRAEVAPVGSSKPAAPTLNTLMRRWLASKDFAATTRATTERSIRLIPPTLLNTRIDKLGPGHLEALYAALLAGDRPSGRPLGAGTVRRLHDIIRAAFSAGVRWGWTIDNIAKRAVPPAPPPEKLSTPTPAAVRAAIAVARTLETRQQQRQGRRARSVDRGWSLFIHCLATTGLRQGEALGLTWSQVDLDAAEARIRQSVSVVPGGIAFGPCKTPRSRRDVPLEPQLVEGLRSHLARQQALARDLGADWSPAWFVWPAVLAEEYGTNPTSPQTVRARWYRERSQMGLEGVTPHDLRHFAATQMIAAGVDPVTVAAILGHANPSITLKLYAHIVNDRMRAAAGIMGQLIGGAA